MTLNITPEQITCQKSAFEDALIKVCVSEGSVSAANLLSTSEDVRRIILGILAISNEFEINLKEFGNCDNEKLGEHILERLEQTSKYKPIAEKIRKIYGLKPSDTFSICSKCKIDDETAKRAFYLVSLNSHCAKFSQLTDDKEDPRGAGAHFEIIEVLQYIGAIRILIREMTNGTYNFFVYTKKNGEEKLYTLKAVEIENFSTEFPQ